MLDWLWSLKKADHKEWGKRGPHRDEDSQRMTDWCWWRASLECKELVPPPRTRDERLLYVYHAHLHKYRLDGQRAPAECAKRDVMEKFKMKRDAVVRALSRETKRQIKAGLYPDGRLTNLAGRTWGKDAAASIVPVTDDDGPIPF
jgi:hypothetical protein